MARNCTTGNDLSHNSSGIAIPPISIWVKFKPNWNGGETSPGRSLWVFGGAASKWLMAFQQPGSFRVGLFYGTDARISISDVGLFTAGVWANHLYTADTGDIGGGIGWGTHSYYHDNVLMGSLVHNTLIDQSYSECGVGAAAGGGLTGGYGADGALAEFAIWNRAVTSGERTVLQDPDGGPGCIPSGRIHWVRISGVASPEPAENGPNLTVVGSPAFVTHPAIGNCDGDKINLATINVPFNLDPIALNLSDFSIDSSTLVDAFVTYSPSVDLAPHLNLALIDEPFVTYQMKVLMSDVKLGSSIIAHYIKAKYSGDVTGVIDQLYIPIWALEGEGWWSLESGHGLWLLEGD